MAAEVEITRPHKLLWPDPGITKAGYVQYLDAVGDHMLPWLRSRPLTLIRAPDGVTGKRYFQKAVSSYAPSWIPTVRIAAPSAGRDVDYVVCNDARTLRWLGNQAALELHPAPVRTDRLDRPDLLVMDIDPPEGAFDAAVEVAGLVLEVLDGFGLAAGVKTTGGKGLHVLTPIERRVGEEPLRRAAARITAIVAGRRPDLVTGEFRKVKRKGRVMLDPSRNGTGATIVAPYSPRARDHGPVSAPVLADELGRISPADFTIGNVRDWIDSHGPRRWDDLVHEHQRLPHALVGP